MVIPQKRSSSTNLKFNELQYSGINMHTDQDYLDFNNQNTDRHKP